MLACGALLKNTFCLGVDGTAYLGPHIGDLENLETFEAYEHAIGRMERFLGVRPAVIAHDLHPDYLSTRYALDRPEPLKVAVQHHHAHVCAAMAEHAMSGLVIGVAYDGTGLGTDGQAWGGEILVADYTRFSRIATFRPIRLAGGDLAIRQVWRQALALLDDAFDGDAPLDRFALFGRVPPRDMAVVRAMLAEGVNTPAAHGVGRYFDAVGALGLGQDRVALRGPGRAGVEPRGRSGRRWSVRRSTVGGTAGLAEIDLRPAIRDLAGELHGRASLRRWCRRGSTTRSPRPPAGCSGSRWRPVGRLPVVLSGGVFQNALLVERVHRAARPVACRWCGTSTVPPGDGGIALGQAVIANAVVQSGSQEPCRRDYVPRRAGQGGRGRRQLRRRSTSGACAGRCCSTSSMSRWRSATTSSITSGFAIRRIPESEIDETLALFEELLKAADEDDLMAGDVRAEIAATGDGPDGES